MASMRKYIKNYKKYEYDPKENGALIATADCKYYGFDSKLKVVVDTEKKYKDYDPCKKCIIEFKVKNKKITCILTCLYNENDFEEMRLKNNFVNDMDLHLMYSFIDDAYNGYKKEKGV